MAERYKKKQLQLLRNTEKTLLYCSRKNKNGFTDVSFIKKNQQFYSSRQNQKRYSFDTIKKSSKLQAKQSIDQIRKKLSNILQSKTEQNKQGNNTQLSTEHTIKNKKTFRINFLKSHIQKKQNQGELKKILQELDGPEEVKTSNIALKKVQDLTQWKNNQLYSFRRDFLRRHGQDKCFYNALKVRNQKIEPTLIRWKFTRKGTNKPSLREGSLQYSGQDFDIGSEVQSWKKSMKQIQWMSLSQLQPKDININLIC